MESSTTMDMTKLAVNFNSTPFLITSLAETKSKISLWVILRMDWWILGRAPVCIYRACQELERLLQCWRLCEPLWTKRSTKAKMWRKAKEFQALISFISTLFRWPIQTWYTPFWVRRSLVVEWTHKMQLSSWRASSQRAIDKSWWRDTSNQSSKKEQLNRLKTKQKKYLIK